VVPLEFNRLDSSLISFFTSPNFQFMIGLRVSFSCSLLGFYGFFSCTAYQRYSHAPFYFRIRELILEVKSEKVRSFTGVIVLSYPTVYINSFKKQTTYFIFCIWNTEVILHYNINSSRIVLLFCFFC
jgi:hypothetical protein